MSASTKLTYNAIPKEFNLAGFLFEKSLSSGIHNKTAFILEDGNVCCYGELFKWVKKFAEFLQEYSLRREERLVILLPDCLEFVIGFLGILWRGNVAVLINEAASYDDIFYMINDSRANCILTTQEWKEKIINYNFSYLKTWILIDETPTLLASLADQDDTRAPAQTSRDEAAFWVYTSGSTGKPKGVIHTHGNPIVATENYAINTLKITAADIIYSGPPMAFSYGLGTTLYMVLYVGASAILSKHTNAFGQIEIINHYRPTIFFGVPNHFATILALKDIMPLEPSSLRLCVSAGEKLPMVIWENWQQQYELRICEGIGTTESTHIFISNRPDHCVPGSTGQAVAGYQIDIVDEHGDSVGPETIGLLEVGGEGFMLGYWNKLPETRKILVGNKLRLNDYYQVDKKGNYYFCGRSDDLIKVNAIWVLPTEIEDVLLQHALISEAAVTVATNKQIGTSEMIAFVSLKSMDVKLDQTNRSLKNFLNTKLPKYKIPKQFYYIDKLPRTTTGKIYRQKLSNLLEKKEYECT